MSRIQALHGDTLSDAPLSTRIRRHLAFKDEECLVVRSQVDRA
jgi:hypothetical protein